MNKKNFIKEFDAFLMELENKETSSGKCYFKLINGTEYQGWIDEIQKNEFTFNLSGPLALEEPVSVKIEDIDLSTFAYWDSEISKWVDYFKPDNLNNRARTKPQQSEKNSKLKNALLAISWFILIFGINQIGRYLFVVFFEGDYEWYKIFYIVVAGSVATLISASLFFIANYFVSKKIKEPKQFSFTIMRLFIMALSITIAFIGERLYLIISDYLLFN